MPPVCICPYRLRRRLISSLLTAAVFICLLYGSGFGFGFSSDPSLPAAARHCDWQQVQRLLQQKGDVNACRSDGMTALHWAALHDQPQIAAQLLQAGARSGAENRYGVPPLYLACLNGSGELVELLLKFGADANARLPGGETVLMTAARTGRPEPVRLLLQSGAMVNAREDRDQTAIMWAAADGHSEVVDLLITAGADFQTPLKSGFTPLMFAVREGRTNVVRSLLNAGDDVNQAMRPQKSGRKAARPGTSPLMLAVENGHFELALMLLREGADPNDQQSGFAPLHALSWVRKPNRGDGDDGDPPPTGSGDLSSLDFVRQLIACGADVNLRLARGNSGKGRLSHNGATPFLMACDTADVPLMRLLVELGADPLIPNADGSTPLMAAAGFGTLAPGEEAGTEEEVLDAVQLALEFGGDPNVVDASGETAMHGAAYANMPRIVHYLAKHGARIDIWNIPNKHGWTPLRIAEGYRPGNFKPSPETVEALHAVMQEAGVRPPESTPAPAPAAADNYPDSR